MLLRKAVLLGWDGVPPSLVFDDLAEVMPNLSQLTTHSNYGALRSTKPPITIPAWMCMATGCDPGQLGLYGFRHREPGNYKDIWIPDSNKIKPKKLWDFVGEKHGKVIVIGMPPSYPPPKVNGHLISGFLAPGIDKTYTYPESLMEEIEDIVGEYSLDVFYRTEEKEELYTNLIDMVKKRHKLTKYLMKEKPWDLFVLMEVGSDRLHHGFWRFYDREHHKYEPGNEYESKFVDFYKLLDKQLGELLEIMPDDTLFVLTSDHGAKGRKGAFCINQWLEKKGLLSLKKQPTEPQSLEDLDIDWKNTKAWGWGGYYSRIFVNVEGYEEQGTVPPHEYEGFRINLAKELLKIKGPNGEVWKNIVDKPENIYEECKGDYPDLMVYFDDLCWRGSSSMGHESMYFYGSAIGPDDAVHDWDGIYVTRFPGQTEAARKSQDILDIAPTILEFMGLETEDYMTGQAIRRQ